MSRSVEFWDRHFLALAEGASKASKDPSTKVGAVIVRPDRTITSLGYNGFPRGIADTEARLNDRNVKYELVIHGEINAILSASESVKGHCLYTWPLLTCNRCAVLVIQAGISRVVAPRNFNPRWNDSLTKAMALYAEARVECVLYDLDVI